MFFNLAGMMGSGELASVFIQTIPSIWREGGETIKDEDVTGELELRNVHFTYPAKLNAPVLKGVSLKIDPKEKRVVALCGTSGCGKSSIIGMIQRFYDPAEGEVLFNGKNIKELDGTWYHN